MCKSFRTMLTAAVLAASALQVQAGGFWLTLGNPEASPEVRAKGAAIMVKATGCHEPEKAEVTGTAIGIVDGQRKTIPLKLLPLDTPGLYAVTQQWPGEGRWVLQFVGKDTGRITHTLVPAGAGGVERNAAKWSAGEPTEAEVTAMLSMRATQQARK